MTKTSNALWTGACGSIVCTAHAGAYLQAAIHANPRRKTHTTPITTWTRIDRDALVAEFTDAGLPASAADCETCSVRDYDAPTVPTVDDDAPFIIGGKVR